MAEVIETRETLIIETPERVPLEFALASIGNRFLAVAVDHLIQFSLMFLIAWLLSTIYGLGNAGPAVDEMIVEMPKWTVAILIIVISFVFSGYFAFFEWIWSGQTPGKRLLKLRVIRDDGRPVTFWESVARNLLRIFDAVPGFVIPIYSVGLIAVFLSPRDQRIGDLFAGTVVIRERADEAPSFEAVFSTERISDAALKRVYESVPFKADLDKLSEREIEVVESFLRRRFDLGERQRLWMAWRVALPIMYKLKPAYDKENFSYEAFLEELLRRFNQTQRRF